MKSSPRSPIDLNAAFTRLTGYTRAPPELWPAFSQKKKKILKINQLCSMALLTQRVWHLIALIYYRSDAPGIKFALPQVEN
jgi:hypothetical protein